MDDLQLNQNEQMQHEIMHQQQQAVEQQPQFRMDRVAMEQQVAVEQQQIHQPTAYESFLKNLQPLPPRPVAQAPALQEMPEKTKSQKRREKNLLKRIQKENEQEYARANKLLAANPHLIDETMVKGMYVFRQKSTRDKWAQEKLPHYKLTREETLRRIIDDGDYSNFENLDVLMRNVIASRELRRFETEYQINEHSNPQNICQQMKQKADPAGSVSLFVNPALRLALSLAQRTEGISEERKQFYHALDEAMTTEVMVATLTHCAQKENVREYFAGKGVKNPVQQADFAIAANKAQQIQIAKRLLLMQLSDFRKITTTNGEANSTPWDSPVAVALSHCSRVALTFPKLDEAGSNEQQQELMWRSVLTTNGGNAAQDNSRMCSTHSITCRSVKDTGIMGSREEKVKFNLRGQRGMNCAIGGLGNAGISGKTLCNDGSCGHFYSMHKKADRDHYGAMLMGLESDENGVMNQMGHTHDWHATAEKASSLGGQRADEIGDKYGGRQCDLSGMSASDISAWMQALEDKMQQWQTPDGGMDSEEAVRTMRMLAGVKLDANGWARLRQTLNVGANVADGFHI